MAHAEILGIPVAPGLVQRWRSWFAPDRQPFRTDWLPPTIAAAVPRVDFEPTPEWRDTFFMYGGKWTWLKEHQFMALSPSVRRALLAARRRSVRPKAMPAWPSELAAAGDRLMFDWIASGSVRPSRHAEVAPEMWSAARPALPGARLLAGTFSTAGSGPNCFGTVMVAAGVSDAAGVQVQPDDFYSWLISCGQSITGTRHDDEPGVVFVWTEHDTTAHAAVTIGGGWMLSKPSQSWSSPNVVWSVRDTVHSWRLPATKLSRFRLC